MSPTPDHLPPHYLALRVLWSLLQVLLLLVVAAVVLRAFPPGDLIGDAGDWARSLQHQLL